MSHASELDLLALPSLPYPGNHLKASQSRPRPLLLLQAGHVDSLIVDLSAIAKFCALLPDTSTEQNMFSEAAQIPSISA